jgi:hypothetical protein
LKVVNKKAAFKAGFLPPCLAFLHVIRENERYAE